MFRVSQSEFEELVNKAIDALPKKYLARLNNVVIVTEDEPTPEQRIKLHLHNGQTLYGLYEGIPMTQRGTNYNMVLPDKITIFKLPIEYGANNYTELQEQVRHTLWHEVAHFFGLNHDAIYQRDGTHPPEK
ncbi:metallopeptidase family protein [Candidatus Saccharibacteria bacterium]|nr:metallopeptidase family protein [Candidatus Saccharibacteria bacterium]